MRLVKPSFEIMQITPNALQLLERAGRTCYKTEDRITPESAGDFIKRIVHDYRHESVIEHAVITIKFIVDRGVTHELVRHRLCAFSQESTRYCNYGKKNHVTFIIPPWVDVDPGEYAYDKMIVNVDSPDQVWWNSLLEAESAYLSLLSRGWQPQQARSVLPNSLKTEIVTTANFRQWRHMFKMRTSAKAHPQMREIMDRALVALKDQIQIIFDDIGSEQ